jgi:exodeoxyribonuclease V alpha subunit
VNNANLINDKNRIYELSSFFFENESARLIAKMLDTKSSCKLNPDEAEDFIERYEKQNSVGIDTPFKCSPAQVEAIKSFYTEKIMIMTGGPGTGKTSTTKAFVQILKEKGIQYELLTPTGIAAKKLGNATGSEAYTIHRRLGYKGNSWDCNNTNKYNTDVVICDEVSMVDQEVFYRLLSALYSRTKIVFVGDNDQLPSVGPGCVLKELIESKKIKTIFLDKIFRQDKCSEIILEAKKIRDGDTDLTYFRSEPGSDIWHISDKDEKRIENLIIRFALQLKSKAKEKNKNKITFQIITPRNEGPLSVFSLNTALQQALNPPNPDNKELKIDSMVIRVGDRIIIRKNNYTHGVFNGDVGKVIQINPFSVLVDIEDFFDTYKRIDLPIKDAEEMLKLAYTITVHKSQGSEYSIVIIPLIKAHGTMLLQRNLLYTAITRAKKKVVLIGQTSAIEQTIKNDKIQKRNTLLAERINQWTTNTGISLHDIFSPSSGSQNNHALNRLLSLEGGSY